MEMARRVVVVVVGGGRGRHRHSSSVDGSSTMTSSTGVFGEIMDAKKAMPPDKLAELWSIDPKRAKRSCFLFFGFFFVCLLLSKS